jgi:ornithine carbamoyltransferase
MDQRSARGWPSTVISALGGHHVDLPLKLGEREAITDTATILDTGFDAVVIRTSAHFAVRVIAEHRQVPTVDAMTVDSTSETPAP